MFKSNFLVMLAINNLKDLINRYNYLFKYERKSAISMQVKGRIEKVIERDETLEKEE